MQATAQHYVQLQAIATVEIVQASPAHFDMRDVGKWVTITGVQVDNEAEAWAIFKRDFPSIYYNETTRVKNTI